MYKYFHGKTIQSKRLPPSASVTNRKSEQRVHHPSRELWCQRQRSAPYPAAEEAPAAKGNTQVSGRMNKIS